MLYEYEGLCNLLAALFNLAHRDAAQGREDAINFLDCTVPTWRDVARRRRGRKGGATLFDDLEFE